MTNTHLQDALADAKMTEGELAEAVGVDAKTVSRWVARETRVPHPRHRRATAKALGVGEDMLWPAAVRAAIKTGWDREIVAAYPARSMVPRTVWRDLIAGAKDRLTFAGYTNYFLWLELDNLRGVLRRKLADGGTVRFLLGDPDSDITRERERVEQTGLSVSTRIRVTLEHLGRLDRPVDARFSDRHIAMSVFEFDEQMLVCTHLADLLGNDSPTYHLKRRDDGGLYDRYHTHVEYLWKTGTPVGPPPE